MRWLKGALNASPAQWKLVANQVMITSLDAVPRNPLNTDSWDGYGAEPARVGRGAAGERRVRDG